MLLHWLLYPFYDPIKNFFKSTFGKKVVSESVEGGAKTGAKTGAKGLLKWFGNRLTVISETLGWGFDIRNRMKKDDDGDGVGGQTPTQAVAGASVGTIASLTTFFTGLALFPEGISTGVGLIGLLGLSMLSDFVGNQAANVTDSITGVKPPGESDTSDDTSDGSVDNVDGKTKPMNQQLYQCHWVTITVII